jgi:hypothetical protein
MALASKAARPDSGFQDRIKGMILFAPEVKTQHNTWKKTFGTPLPDHATVITNAGRIGGRARDDLQQIDENGQETGITTPTLIFANHNDHVVSSHYQQRVAQDPTNTGVRAFIGRGGDHYNMDGQTLQLITQQTCTLLQYVAGGGMPPTVPAHERVTEY